MKQPDYVTLLRQCGEARSLVQGRRVHARITSHQASSLFIGNAIVMMYGRCSSVQEARQAFDRICGRNVFSWNILMSAYAQNGSGQAASLAFHRMPQRDLVSWTTMLVGYSSRGMLEEARAMFESIPSRTTVPWNAMISGYVQNGQGRQALSIFRLMQLDGLKPTVVTFISVLDACGLIGDLSVARTTRDLVVKAAGLTTHPAVVTCMVNMFGMCGSVTDAWNAFCEQRSCQTHSQPWSLEANVVHWSAMILACVQNGRDKEAVHLFVHMDLEGVQPDGAAFVAALDACANSALLLEGILIHQSAVESWSTRVAPKDRVFVETSALNMYSKCGQLTMAWKLFSRSSQRDNIMWSAMVAAFGRAGHHESCLSAFRMMNLEGFQPTAVTFVGLLLGCSHAGKFDQGVDHFVSMICDYGVQPIIDNYQCLVDLLGRAGKLDAARELISGLSIDDTDVAWRSLLTACRVQSNVGVGMHAAKVVSKLDPGDSVPYLMVFDILRNQRSQP